MADHTIYTGTSLPHRQRKVDVSHCPTCGGLQCLCRPRFFAGQLLTEDDLGRLDRYIVEKNKLHNRYLHGWGVVCGLEVVCHNCKGWVTVKQGYAIDPCGNDIIVCENDTVDVCALIKKCKDKERRDWECEPPYRDRDNGCKDVKETWVLAIRYDEKPSRGITALTRKSDVGCCSRCNCGGSSDCGCGCHEDNNGKSNNGSHNFSKRTPAQCEPTMLCEGYRYEVYKLPCGDNDESDPSEMIKRFWECFGAYFNGLPQIPKPVAGSDNITQQQWHDYCCNMKIALKEFFMTHPTNNCQILETLSGIVCPVPDSDNFNEVQKIAWNAFVAIFFQHIFHCFCSALLPPCPEPAEDTRVVLATITVSKDKGDCCIDRVCNWTTLRKFVTTFPNLQYWLSPFDNIRKIREGLEDLCCEFLGLLQIKSGINVDERFTFRESAKETKSSKSFSTLINDAFAGKSSRINAESMFKGMMGEKDDKGEPYLKDIERENLPQFLMINNVLGPLLKTMVPDDMKDMVSFVQSIMKTKDMPTEKVRTNEINELKTKMSKMQETLKKQQKTINEISKKTNNSGK